MTGGSYLQYSTTLRARYFHMPKHGKVGPIVRFMNWAPIFIIQMLLLMAAGIGYLNVFKVNILNNKSVATAMTAIPLISLFLLR